MDGIPPARDTDAEDVVWALQTAEALWKRNERGDAIVWLRRAAQAAGETNDDDRALVLARGAAELTEWLARASSAALPTMPPVSEAGSAAGVEIDTLLRTSQIDPSELAPAPVSLEPEAIISEAVPSLPAPHEAPMLVSSRPPARVLTAAESHAGMLDPWSEPPPVPPPKPSIPAVPREAAPPIVPRVDPPPAAKPVAFDEEVVTSAGPLAPARAEELPLPKPPTQRAPKPPPPKPKPQQRPAPALEPAPALAPAPLEPLDLSAVEAFTDLPDDARDALAKAARMQRYSKGEALGLVGLAFVVNGDVHVMAAGVPTQATTIGKGSVLRARGTLDDAIPLELVCASESCIAATWDEHAVESAFAACPWVEEDLRASGDRVQAMAGTTLGTLGQKLSPELRTSIVDRLTMRVLAEHEFIVTEGVPVPGILLVGAGSVELVLNDVVTTQVTAGQFILPAEALSAGPSTTSARAATGGALLFVADRKLSSELFATEPLLLELFAGW